MIFILGYSVSYDLNRVDMAVVDFSRSESSRRLVEAFASNRIFTLHALPAAAQGGGALRAAEEMLRRRAIKEILVIPADFSRRLAAHGSCEVGIVIDGSDANIANLVYEYQTSGCSGNSMPPSCAGTHARLDTKIYFQSRGPEPVLHPRPGRRHPADDIGQAHFDQHFGSARRARSPCCSSRRCARGRSSWARPSLISSSRCWTAW